jgi:hypothetical protein
LAQKNYEVLNKIIETIIPSVFTYFQVQRLRENTYGILEFYLIGGFLNEETFKKLVLKFEKSSQIFLRAEKCEENNSTQV